nr:MAG TPA: Ig-like domain protein [Caudoviricetes sp.]
MPKTLSSLAVGTKVEVPVQSAYQSRFGAKIVFKIADKNHSGYPSNSVTLITEKIIQLMCSDAKEPSNSNSDRRNYGNNRHIHSNILQWLNSNATAGKWYSAKHGQDAPPNNANVWNNYNEYDAWAGFLAMLDPKFVAELMETTLTVVKSSTDGGSYETFTAKMFLASTTEVGLANENGIAEGKLLALFSNDASRIAYPTAECVNNSEYTNSNFTTSKGWYWWLRTPASSDACSVRCVHSGGTLDRDSAFSGLRGVRPLCNLKSEILVSDNPNSSGNYEIIYNSAPSAPPSITAPDQCFSGQEIEISCAVATDPDGDTLTYVFERSTNSGAWTQVQSSAARTFSEMVSTAWNTLQYRVKAVDTANNSSAYTTSGTIAVIHNQPPVISGQNADLGVKREGFTYEYSVTDPDNDVVNVVEKIDGTSFNTRNNVPLGEPLTLSISGNTFTELSNARHTIEIVATDSASNSATRTLTFTKAINSFVITLAEPLEAVSQPTRCNIKVNRDIPAGGTFKVEACNNPYDVTPIWEDCTNAVIAGLAHVFKNKTNTAVQFGLNIRVTVERGDALTACWVSGIGGNFE